MAAAARDAARTSERRYARPVERRGTRTTAVAIGDVDDAQAFVQSAINAALGPNAAYLSDSDREDVMQDLLLAMVRLHGRYDPHRADAIPFNHLARNILPKRVTDWYRRNLGDTRYGPPPEVVSLDAAGATDLESATPAPLYERVADEHAEDDWETLLDSIDHDRLSARARGALRQIALVRAREGVSIGAAADRLGQTHKGAAAALKRLRAELGDLHRMREELAA